jgi:putative oxidoreductase
MPSTYGVKGTDGILLVARILLALLFLGAGSRKLLDYSGTLQYMTHAGAPLPVLATVIAIAVEFFVSIAIILGVATRPLAALLALYTLGTALIGHHYWTMTGMDRMANEINFYKNISIIGGLLLLYVTGAGDYSADGWRRRRRAAAPTGG